MRRFGILLLFCLAPFLASAEDFSVQIGSVRGFDRNPITIHSPVPGTLILSVEDVRSWTVEIPEGESMIEWDGLGPNEEILPEGSYCMRAFLDCGNTRTLSTELSFQIGECRNALLFALPKSDTLYAAGAPWTCEMRTARRGSTIVTEFYRCDQPDQLLAAKRNKVESGTFITYMWDGRLDGRMAEPGDYLLRFYEKSNPDYVREATVRVADGKPQTEEVTVTGPIMPEAGLNDEQLWAFLQQPSVVADLAKPTDHLTLRKEKGKGRKMGTIHGQSQAVEVLAIEGGYARIGAYTHESGDYTEGWVPLKKLKVVHPHPIYALVIDKVTQTLTVWQQGNVLGSMPVSTGLMAKDKLIRETPAGSFLTVERVTDFKDDAGYRYDCAIRYDGGNLLHQIGYRTRDGRKDFSTQQAQLGVKASHGCIRIPAQPGADGLNAYWLYTHLPAGTRVLILDDPAQRALQKLAAGEKTDLPSVSPVASPPLQPSETELTLTVGGDVVLGTREAWWTRPDALPAFLSSHGMDYPFRSLQTLFQKDDMTFVNLECVLKADAEGENTEKEYRFRGLPEWTECLTLSGIDHVSIANNHYIDYGTEGREATQTALQTAGIAYSGFETTHIREHQGWKIGFAGCRETVYQQDPTVVYRDIRSLKEAGCDVILYTCHWGKEYSPTHKALQERIAAAAAAAGADIIIGGHPHVVQGIDAIGSTPVLYSLGNLMFGGTIDMRTFDGMLAQLRLRFDEQGYAGCTITPIPILTSSSAREGINDYQTVIAQGKDKERILQAIQSDTPFALMESMYFPSASDENL